MGKRKRREKTIVKPHTRKVKGKTVPVRTHIRSLPRRRKYAEPYIFEREGAGRFDTRIPDEAVSANTIEMLDLTGEIIRDQVEKLPDPDAEFIINELEAHSEDLEWMWVNPGEKIDNPDYWLDFFIDTSKFFENLRSQYNDYRFSELFELSEENVYMLYTNFESKPEDIYFQEFGIQAKQGNIYTYHYLDWKKKKGYK